MQLGHGFSFFQTPVIAFIDIGILIYLNQKILKIIQVHSKYYFIFIYYLIWLIFAAFLNASIIWLN